MKTQTLGRSSLVTSSIAYGCMPLGRDWDETPLAAEAEPIARAAIEAAIEKGITLFDHADLYCRGKSEEVFGKVVAGRSSLRQRVILQSKCGIVIPRKGGVSFSYFDFRKDYILRAVEGSLKRLGSDYLDVLLLHRPDALWEPEEVAAAFEQLEKDGKVRHFGVSNQNAQQMAFLQRHMKQPIVANQLELNLVHSGLLTETIWFNQNDSPTVRGVSGTIEYCREHGVTVQAWAPTGGGRLVGRSLDQKNDPHGHYARAAACVRTLAERHHTSPDAVVIAWLLRHPAKIQPILGTTKPERISRATEAINVELSHEEWYELLIAGCGRNMP